MQLRRKNPIDRGLFVPAMSNLLILRVANKGGAIMSLHVIALYIGFSACYGSTILLNFGLNSGLRNRCRGHRGGRFCVTCPVRCFFPLSARSTSG